MTLFILTLFSITSYALPEDTTQWTNNDHWENTQLNFQSTIFGTINPQKCIESSKQVIACLAVLNKAIEIMKPDKKILVQFSTTEPTEGMGPFKLIDYSELSSKEFFELKKKYFTLVYGQLENSSFDGLILFDPTQIMNLFSEKIITEANDQLMAGTIYNTYLRLRFDPHTYIIPTTIINNSQRSSVKRKGIGIVFAPQRVKQEEFYLIQEVLTNSPAQKAGILKGDLILKVNEQSDLRKVSNLFKDSNVQSLNFELLRNKKILSIHLNKDFYTVTNVETAIIERDDREFLYIKLRSFMDQKGCQEIKKAGENALANHDIEGVILDLRNNGGGYVSQAICISKLFLEDNSIVWSIKRLNSNKFENQHADRTNNIFGQLHTATLINGNSASAGESLPMYLQDYRKSFIVGEKSYGKGSMQNMRYIDQDRRMMMGRTQALFYGPKGVSPQIIGVSPDFQVLPIFDQKKPTDFTREADNYLLVIENESSLVDRISKDRKRDKLKIKKCLSEEEKVKARYNQEGELSRLVFDNQLETAFEVITCANNHIPIYNQINI